MLVVVLAFAFSLTALANFSLPAAPHSLENNGNLGQWITDGTDEKSSPVTWATMRNSTGIVFEMPEPDVGMVIVVFGAFNGWDWGGGSIDIDADAWADGKVTVTWAQIGINLKALEEEDDGHTKILFGSWSAQYNDLGITRVYLTGVGGAASTGVITFLFPALAALAVGTSGTIIIGRKIKK